MIIMQVSVQSGLNLTGLELSLAIQDKVPYFSLTFLKFNSYSHSHHMQVCDISGFSFRNSLVLIIFPTSNACVPVDESLP